MNLDVKNWPLKTDRVGDFLLGMSLTEFKEKFATDKLIDNGFIDLKVSGEYITMYCADCCTVTFSVRSEKLGLIFLNDNFKGKYQGQIGIGSTQREAKDFCGDQFSTDGGSEDVGFYIDSLDEKSFIELQDDWAGLEPDDSRLNQVPITGIALELTEDWRI